MVVIVVAASSQWLSFVSEFVVVEVGVVLVSNLVIVVA